MKHNITPWFYNQTKHINTPGAFGSPGINLCKKGDKIDPKRKKVPGSYRPGKWIRVVLNNRKGKSVFTKAYAYLDELDRKEK